MQILRVLQYCQYLNFDINKSGHHGQCYRHHHRLRCHHHHHPHHQETRTLSFYPLFIRCTADVYLSLLVVTATAIISRCIKIQRGLMCWYRHIPVVLKYWPYNKQRQRFSGEERQICTQRTWVQLAMDPYESVAVANSASSQNCPRVPVTVLSKPVKKGVINIKFRCK